MQLKGYYQGSVQYSVGDIVLFTDGHVYHMIKPAKYGTTPHNTLFWLPVDQRLEESVLCLFDSMNLGRRDGTTIGDNSSVSGSNLEASGSNSNAEGYSSKASGSSSHAEGQGTTAGGICSHTEGTSTVANGTNAHAEGLFTKANRRANHVFGEYNIEDTSGSNATKKGDYIEIVGNGTSEARANARTLDWSGNEWLAGSVEPVGGLILKSSTASSTKRFMITIDDDGELSATELT